MLKDYTAQVCLWGYQVWAHGDLCEATPIGPPYENKDLALNAAKVLTDIQSDIQNHQSYGFGPKGT